MSSRLCHVLLGALLLLSNGHCRRQSPADAALINDAIVLELEQASAKMAAFYADPRPETSMLVALESTLLATADRVKKIRSYRGDDSLQEEALAILDFYQRLCRETNRSLLETTMANYYTAEDSLLTQRLLAAILVEENRRNQRFLAIQDSFAVQYGILLVAEPYVP
jgi:hypothetical protein